MAYQQVFLELVRDGQCTPWGFRMTGGADIGTPLVIQKVNLGSPSEGELQKGDIILQLRDNDATRLSHQFATDLITRAGSTLKLLVARSIGSTPGGTPVNPSLRPLLMFAPADGNQNLFKPLPTTNFNAQRQRRCSTESYTSTTSSDTEKDAITNQPYRSIPLISPSAKPSKDIPAGSYLRHEPSFRTGTPPNTGPRISDAFMITKVQEAILEAAHSSSRLSSPGRTPTPDMGTYPQLTGANGPQIYLRQYNSPINMYSNQAIVEALGAQTVNMKTTLNDADMLENKKLSNIKQSPTYQLIHGEEWKNLNKGNLQEHEALEEHVYNVMPRGGENYREDIQQSGSFKAIMHNFRGMSDL